MLYTLLEILLAYCRPIKPNIHQNKAGQTQGNVLNKHTQDYTIYNNKAGILGREANHQLLQYYRGIRGERLGEREHWILLLHKHMIEIRGEVCVA